MGFKIRIRTAFIIALLVIGLIPLSVFAWYSYERTVATEFEEVKDRHLLLAHNLSSTLSRYERDVRAAVRSVATSLFSSTDYPGSKELLRTLNIQEVSLIDPETGRTSASLNAKANQPAPSVPAALLAEAKKQANRNQLHFMPVQRTEYGNVIYISGWFQNQLLLARLGTDYFIQIWRQISFGIKGHAATVDQKGNVLAHPLPTWIAAAKNISKVSAVRLFLLPWGSAFDDTRISAATAARLAVTISLNVL